MSVGLASRSQKHMRMPLKAMCTSEGMTPQTIAEGRGRRKPDYRVILVYDVIRDARAHLYLPVAMPQQLPQIPVLRIRHLRLGKRSSSNQAQRRGILAIGLLLTYPLARISAASPMSNPPPNSCSRRSNQRAPAGFALGGARRTSMFDVPFAPHAVLW